MSVRKSFTCWDALKTTTHTQAGTEKNFLHLSKSPKCITDSRPLSISFLIFLEGDWRLPRSDLWCLIGKRFVIKSQIVTTSYLSLEFDKVFDKSALRVHPSKIFNPYRRTDVAPYLTRSVALPKISPVAVKSHPYTLEHHLFFLYVLKVHCVYMYDSYYPSTPSCLFGAYSQMLK